MKGKQTQRQPKNHWMKGKEAQSHPKKHWIKMLTKHKDILKTSRKSIGCE